MESLLYICLVLLVKGACNEKPDPEGARGHAQKFLFLLPFPGFFLYAFMLQNFSLQVEDDLFSHIGDLVANALQLTHN